MNAMSRRIAETAGMLMIGDGLLALSRPAEHCALWRGGAPWWSKLMTWFSDHPQITRAVGGAEVAAGLWLAFEQQQRT